MKNKYLKFCFFIFAFSVFCVPSVFAKGEKDVLENGDTGDIIKETGKNEQEEKIIYTEFITPDSHVYDAMHILALQAGRVNLSDRRSQSKAEIATYLKAIDVNELDAKTRELYDMVYEHIYNKKPLLKKDWFCLDTNLLLSLQVQYVDDKHEPRADKFTRYNSTPPLISVPLSFSFTPYVNLYGDFNFRKNYWATQITYPYTNMPLTSNSFDANFPTRAGLNLGNRFMRFSIGRGSVNVGKTLSGSMLLSDTSDNIDYASLAFFHKDVHLSSTVYSMERYRFLFTHEVHFTASKYVGIRLYEGTTLAGSFDFRYLNPMMIFHNLFGWEDKLNSSDPSPNGSQFGVGLEVVPIKGLRFYGQFEMNQFQTKYELEHYSSSAKKTPNSLGGLAGVEYNHVTDKGFLDFNAEFMYANPWLNIMENKKISLFDIKTETVAPSGYEGKKKPIHIWLSNPLGPDTTGFFVKFGFREFQKFDFEFLYRFLAKGENEAKFLAAGGDYYPSTMEEVKYKTPSGTPTFFHTLKAKGKYYILPNLKTLTEVSWTIAHGKNCGNSFSISSSLNYQILPRQAR
ncbi:MAG: hypothetical protein CR988_02125 [Treponema sp.]|nr:MAG: hypothetical protein CR988_02125 [Treponema sp.]